MTKAELYLAYDYKRIALEAEDKRVAAGEPRPENYQDLVNAVEQAHRAWQDATD